MRKIKKYLENIKLHTKVPSTESWPTNTILYHVAEHLRSLLKGNVCLAGEGHQTWLCPASAAWGMLRGRTRTQLYWLALVQLNHLDQRAAVLWGEDSLTGGLPRKKMTCWEQHFWKAHAARHMSQRCLVLFPGAWQTICSRSKGPWCQQLLLVRHRELWEPEAGQRAHVRWMWNSAGTDGDGGSSWALLPARSPVQVVDEVPHVAGQDHPVLPHVPVVPKHTHWNVGRHFGKLPQNIVKCPSSERREQMRE